MKLNRLFIVAVVVLGCVILTAHWGLAAIPSGSVGYSVTDEGNLIFDVTGTMYDDIAVDVDGGTSHIRFSADVTQNGAGKISGAGSTTVDLELPGLYTGGVDGKYKAAGTITSKRGVTKIRYSATVTAEKYLEGKMRKLSATDAWTAIINALTGKITINYKYKASASGLGAATNKGEEEYDFSEDGSWDLGMVLTNDGKKKITGTATVTLAAGTEYSFTVKGTYNLKKDTSTLVLSSSDASSKGSRLKVTMIGNQISAITGKVSGQTIAVK